MDRLSTCSVLASILSYLDVKDLNSAILVCKRFHDIIERNRIIMAKWPIRLKVNSSHNVICIAEMFYICNENFKWQAYIFDNRIHMIEMPDERSGIAKFIARRRRDKMAIGHDTIDKNGVTWRNFTFNISSNFDGVREVVQMLRERFAPTTLILTGEPMRDDQFRLILFLLKNIHVQHLDLGPTPINDGNIEILKSLSFSCISLEMDVGDSSLVFQLNTARSTIYAKCHDIDIYALKRVLKEWSEDKRDILQLMLDCNRDIISNGQLGEIFNNLLNVEYSANKFDRTGFSWKRDTAIKRTLNISGIVISISEIVPQIFTTHVWQVKICENNLHVQEKRIRNYGIANTIARRRDDEVITFPDTIDFYGVTWKNCTFDISNNFDGIREALQVILGLFAPKSLTLAGEPLCANQFKLIVQLLKHIRVPELLLGRTNINDGNIELLKSLGSLNTLHSVPLSYISEHAFLDFSSISFETTEGDSHLMFQLNTGRSSINAHCNDMNINILERVLKEWSEGRRDILQMIVTCPSSNFDADQLEHILASLQNVKYSTNARFIGKNFSLERDTILNRKLYGIWASVLEVFTISSEHIL